ncbi:hypothetical protein FRB90_010785 [Tulasnella sp. 427]|nr:hypothetical protein FRB90_010785 [Tulasnella sp. 427]
MIIWNTICLGVLPVGLRLLGISPFRVAITICGCRLIVNMRKAAIAQASGSVPEVPPSINRSITAAGTGTEEQPSDSSDHGNAPPGTSAWLHLAQRIGLPPPIQADFRHPWYEPVMTLNKTTHTIDRPHEAPRPMPDQRQRLTWNSRMRPHNLNLSVHGSNGISSLADGSIAFRSMDSTQTSGKPDYLDVDDQVEISPTAHPKSKSPQSFFEV